MGDLLSSVPAFILEQISREYVFSVAYMGMYGWRGKWHDLYQQHVFGCEAMTCVQEVTSYISGSNDYHSANNCFLPDLDLHVFLTM